MLRLFDVHRKLTVVIELVLRNGILGKSRYKNQVAWTYRGISSRGAGTRASDPTRQHDRVELNLVEPLLNQIANSETSVEARRHSRCGEGPNTHGRENHAFLAVIAVS